MKIFFSVESLQMSAKIVNPVVTRLKNMTIQRKIINLSINQSINQK